MNKPTKDQKQKRDEAISIIWEAKKAEWIMKDLSPIFKLHIDTIYAILKEAREAKIITGTTTALFTGNKNIKK